LKEAGLSSTGRKAKLKTALEALTLEQMTWLRFGKSNGVLMR
jgi:hypothetical protein